MGDTGKVVYVFETLREIGPRGKGLKIVADVVKR